MFPAAGIAASKVTLWGPPLSNFQVTVPPDLIVTDAGEKLVPLAVMVSESFGSVADSLPHPTTKTLVAIQTKIRCIRSSLPSESVARPFCTMDRRHGRA